MRIIRATHLGMCFGVRDAIALALASAEGGPLTSRPGASPWPTMSRR
jgi:hypothetical protein